MKKLFMTFFLIISSNIHAEYVSTSPCFAPTKPWDMTDTWQVNSFNNDVDSYKQCIEDFVDEQNEAIRDHRSVAKDAIDEWNMFINYELN